MTAFSDLERAKKTLPYHLSMPICQKLAALGVLLGIQLEFGIGHVLDRALVSREFDTLQDRVANVAIEPSLADQGLNRLISRPACKSRAKAHSSPSVRQQQNIGTAYRLCKYALTHNYISIPCSSATSGR